MYDDASVAVYCILCFFAGAILAVGLIECCCRSERLPLAYAQETDADSSTVTIYGIETIYDSDDEE